MKWRELKVTQSCPTLCKPMGCSLPGSSVNGILQARILEWVAIPFSWGSSQLMDQTLLSHIAGGLFTIWATHIINLPFFDKWHFKICSRDHQILNPFKISTLHVSSIVVVVAADVVFLCIHSSYIFTKIRGMWKKNHTKSCYYFFLISLFVSAEIAET